MNLREGGVVPFDNLPKGAFRFAAIDPPWLYHSNSGKRPGRNAKRHYKCMKLAEIEAMPVGDLLADDSAIGLWITGPMLARGDHLRLFRRWGVRPSGMGWVWIKLNPRAPMLFFTQRDLHMGPGFTTRKNAEFCLLGVRGKSTRVSRKVHEVIISPRREHSRKPEEFFERAVQYTDGPYLELFSRRPRAGWVTCGDEAEKFAR
jgi:N6-adenosine-specific RNA methylase IME4